MKKTILLTIALATMLVSLSGCYWGYPPGHDRGDRYERRDRDDRDERDDRDDKDYRYDHHRDGDLYDRR